MTEKAVSVPYKQSSERAANVALYGIYSAVCVWTQSSFTVTEEGGWWWKCSHVVSGLSLGQRQASHQAWPTACDLMGPECLASGQMQPLSLWDISWHLCSLLWRSSESLSLIPFMPVSHSYMSKISSSPCQQTLPASCSNQMQYKKLIAIMCLSKYRSSCIF